MTSLKTFETQVEKWRRPLIKDAVLKLLNECGISSMPVSLSIIVRELNITIKDMSDTAELDIDTSNFKGLTLVKKNKIGAKYVVYLRDSLALPQKRWSLAHEIAHIILHLLPGCYNAPYPEAESNFFTRNLLAPAAVLDELGAITVNDIARVCNIGLGAARYRIGEMTRHYNYKARYGYTHHDKAFIKQFSSILNDDQYSELLAA